MKTRSVEEKISYRMVLIGAISMLITALLVAGVFRRSFNRQIREDMSAIANIIARAMEQGCAPENFAGEQLRITLIAPNGAVLYESAGVEEPENHLTRPEVQQAAGEGSGFAQRRSRSLGYDTTYYALRLENGSILRIAENTAGTYAIYRGSIQIIFLVLLVLLLILGLAVLFSAAVSRSIVSPINEMAKNLDKIDEAQVPYKELLPFAHILKEDYALRKENEKIRMEFTANVSHELKTPLTSISGYAELLENNMVRPEDVSQFGQKIHKEAKRMTALVGDILKLSALDSRKAGADSTELLPLDLSSIANEVAADLNLNAKNAYITIKKELRPAPVLGDAKLLEELCTNLVDNAIRYNRPGGWVLLATGQKNGLSWLEVRDNGIGIPVEAQSRVFERFYRVDKSRSKATGGTGLGLAIVKHIAALHGGRITLESAPERGTSIRITFEQTRGETL